MGQDWLGWHVMPQIHKCNLFQGRNKSGAISPGYTIDAWNESVGAQAGKPITFISPCVLNLPVVGVNHASNISITFCSQHTL